MRYEVPFLPDPDYQALLTAHRRDLAAVYFRLGPDVPDGRLPGFGDAAFAALRDGLAALPGVPKYGLCNARFHDPARLTRTGLAGLVATLERYREAGVLDGLVYADHYLLTALSEAAPTLASGLTAIPSVNFRLDSAERALALLDYVADTRFRPPAALVLDRPLARDTRRLAGIVARLRAVCPEVRLGLLVNEGCLFACPFRAAHEARIALAGLRPVRLGDDGNERLGCLRLFFEKPGRLFASPFVRPEDVGRLEGLADFCKLSGRTRGPAVLAEVAGAYFAGGYRGNLLWLLDTLSGLSGRLWVENAALPADFFERTDGCSRRCDVCGVCGGLADALVRRRELLLPRPFSA